ncbi:hypothetical protein LJU39_16255 [Citrobacter freundii]|nr:MULTISPECIES: hypothetical protein [Citrobacter]MDM2766044.1 hypothetical protein [Citrobacter sp. Cpo150]MDM2920001.1 hypothetical protein [Citrobacter sp. Cpo032]MEB7576558.1 hypothetical protein [Citrobacter portucalensis]UDV51749.1 hypothetical protein LJU39_16255 [Citrobacter freundii]
MRLFISGMLLLSAQYVNAASNCDINAIVQHAWPDAKPTAEGKLLTQHNQVIDITGNSTQSAICRVWPAHPELTLAAIPLMAQQYSDYDRIGDLELLVLDSTNLDVKQRLRLPERMNDDAIQITGLALDTARWKVTPDQTAFGLRVARTGSSRINPFSEDALSLFVIENNQLRAVLNGIVLENSTGEWDGNCVGTFHDIKRTLALAPDSHNGYFDIRVNEKNVESTAYTDAYEQCASKDKPGKASWVLRYDGKQYAIPKELSPLF